MLIDIDHFKRINDAHGHQAGDEVLRNVALRLSERSRAADVVCRYGGEEFLLLLPDMPQAAALELANRYRMSLETTPIPFGELRIQATLSIGIATYPDHGQSPEDLIECADQAMYQAKTAGRNRVCVFTPEPGAACQPTAGALAEVTPTRSWPAACC
jgi:diguanylate cyclase (GGDEF)-like protein